ncbi:protein phosphatase 2C domain-containing protein [Streptomyces sp. AC627_RSS907]|uniref:protein phosphatase 2C domain-containing protein n=1 Tax=Streptomyces sp. AC627_RSS907 TaxID=2823684 RepID=UPI001C23C5CC|nr:protein phosphatase 2C domain-containing protein [Streptomyces sp. AC627_RSS907]
MRTELVCEPGLADHPNEDFASVGLPASGQGGALVVLDGVTPPRSGTGCLHSVPWFTARLGGALTELTVSLPDVPLADVLSRAIARTSAAHVETCDLSHPRTPQATVVLARWSPSTVEYLVLSDSALLVEAPDGSVTAVLDDRLARLPRSALATDALVDARLRNREGGFFTAAADPAVAARAVTGTLPRAGVRGMVALTDGAARWVETFREGGWADCLTLVRKEGARSLVDRVRELERADAAGSRSFLGRGKTHDDATVVYAEL